MAGFYKQGDEPYGSTETMFQWQYNVARLQHLCF